MYVVIYPKGINQLQIKYGVNMIFFKVIENF